MASIAILCGCSIFVVAQIPNPGFENWTAGDPDHWATSNVFPVGLVNVFQTDDSHSGSSALRGEVVSFVGTPMAAIIQSGPGGVGFPISEKYQSIELYYKFTSTGEDRFGVNVALMKDGSAIAQGAVAIPVTVSDYTFLSVPLSYTLDEVPDSAIIQIMIVGPNTGPDVHVGSVMWVDDLVFSMSTGFSDLHGDEIASICYPNPATDELNILLKNENDGFFLVSVYDVYGKELKSVPFINDTGNKGIVKISVSDLPAGLYFYTIDGPDVSGSGKFYVKR